MVGDQAVVDRFGELGSARRGAVVVWDRVEVTSPHEVYSFAIHTFITQGRDVDVMVGGRYLDTYEKRDAVWKSVERRIVTDWAEVNDPSRLDVGHPVTGGTPLRMPDARDPSHQYFSMLGGKA